MEPGENRAGAAFLMGVPLQNQNEKDFFASPGSSRCLAVGCFRSGRRAMKQEARGG
jgi:hypothetical protein